jgi:putative membrane protein
VGGRDGTDRRRPRAVYGVGSDPDPRFSMANERTALAWVRTGLAFVAGGIALTSVSAVTTLPSWVDVAAVLSCLIGAGTAINAVIAWRGNERAMRQGEPLPSPRVLPWLVGAVVVAALAIVALALSQA